MVEERPLRVAVLPRAHPHPGQPRDPYPAGGELALEYSRPYDSFLAMAAAAGREALERLLERAAAVCTGLSGGG